MISKSFISSLLNRIDIVDVIGKLLPLKKAGANYVGLCPFHKEKSPSFTVTQSKQFYHCFGCGAHGSAIDFLVEHQGMGFVEAVEKLASEVNMAVIYEADEAEANKRDFSVLLGLLKTAADFYYEELKVSPVAVNYLKGRGITGDTAKKFGIGYAADAWDSLRRAKFNYDDRNLEIVGLVSPAEARRSRHDRFRGRIMFPIHDSKGNVIAFGGRILDKGSPKYLNSIETPVFDKGSELYGLYQAQRAIRAKSTAIVVEGYMDVVSLVQHGFENTVATMGTATTTHQVQRLLRMADNIVFCFDGDEAGIKAAPKALEVSLPCMMDGKRISFVSLPQGSDPDDFIRREGAAKFEELLAGAETLVTFLLRQLTSNADLKTPEGRSAFVNSTREVRAQLKRCAPGVGMIFRNEVAKIAEMGTDDVDQMYMAPPTTVRSLQFSRAVGVDALKSHKLLLCIVSSPALARRIPEMYLDSKYLTEEAIQVAMAAAKEGVECGSIAQSLEGSPLEGAVTAIQTDILRLGDEFNVEAEFTGILNGLRFQSISAEISEIEAKVEVNGIGTAILTPEERARYLGLLTEKNELARAFY